MKRFMPFLVGALACVACNSVQESGTEAAKGIFVEEKVVVDTMMLKKSVFLIPAALVVVFLLP